jgi:hypothetical protein
MVLSNDGALAGAISSNLAVLDHLIELNQSAQVNEEFTTIVETISTCISNDLMVPNAQLSINRIKRRLNIGSTLPFAPAGVTDHSTASATFHMTSDLPGDLSAYGIRHDNDHASISDIQILPTAQEIISPRQEYLPFADSSQNYLPGLAGLLDKQFQLLREDTVGQLRDSVREEVLRLEKPAQRTMQHTGSYQQGIRKHVYHGVVFSRLCVNRRKGLQVVAEFDQPQEILNKSSGQRKDWWEGNKLLQTDSLVCFGSSSGKTIFLSVCDPSQARHQKSEPNLNDFGKAVSPSQEDTPSLFLGEHRASVLLDLAEWKSEEALWISTHISASNTLHTLVEFPGILLASFRPTLKALQKMNRSLDVPFKNIIAPDTPQSATGTEIPQYARKLGFEFNLDVLSREAGDPITLTPGQPFDFSKLDERSMLDDAQQMAVVQALSNNLALIQGPPGTGKSYTGVAILRALLHSLHTAHLGPIICVCYTKHALDQLLEHLVRHDVGQIIRLGSRSKSAMLQNLTLHHVRQTVDVTKTEKSDKWKHNQEIDQALEAIKVTLSGLNDPGHWLSIREYLEKNESRCYEELCGDLVDEDGFQQVRGHRANNVKKWLRGAHPDFSSDRNLSELAYVPLNDMSASERAALFKSWVKHNSKRLADDLLNAMDSFQDSRSYLDNCHRELDLRCLREAQIIGVTTSGLARNIDLLQRVRAKVMICEEAGEVLEAHTLTAFLPGIDHAILIGDHEQLRPQVNNYDLSHDNPCGKQYSLDVPLFERLIKSTSGDIHIPLTTLKVQRRMHPSIAELVRIPLYPDLEDHPSVSEYPDVNGMRDRLYWFDH